MDITDQGAQMEPLLPLVRMSHRQPTIGNHCVFTGKWISYRECLDVGIEHTTIDQPVCAIHLK